MTAPGPFPSPRAAASRLTFDVTRFGARGVPGNDDTAAIKRAITAAEVAHALTGSAVIYFPAGVYPVSDQIINWTQAQNGIAVIGDGKDVTRIRVTTDLASPLVSIVGNNATGRAEHISFQFLRIESLNRAAAFDAFYCEQSYHIDMIEVYCRTLNGHALHFNDHWDSTYFACHFIGCGSPNATDAAANAVTGSDKATVYITRNVGSLTSNNLEFINCQFESSWNSHVLADDNCRGLQFTTCKFHANQNATLTVPQVAIGGVHTSTWVSCRFLKSQGAAADHVHILAPAARTLTARGLKFIGNTFSDAGGAAIRISDGSDMQFVANSFGWNSANNQSIVVEATVPVGGNDRQITFAENSFNRQGGEPEPVILAPAAITGRFDGLREHIMGVESRAYRQTFMRPAGNGAQGHYGDEEFYAKNGSGTDTLLARWRTTLRNIAAGNETVRWILSFVQNGAMVEYFRVDTNNQQVEFSKDLRMNTTTYLRLNRGSYLWEDSTGDLRIGPRPANAGAEDTTGIVVGTQT